MHNSEIRSVSDFENVCVHVSFNVLAVVLGPTRHSCVSFPCTRARVPHELSWKDTRLTSTIVILTTRYPHDVQHEELERWSRNGLEKLAVPPQRSPADVEITRTSHSRCV